MTTTLSHYIIIIKQHETHARSQPSTTTNINKQTYKSAQPFPSWYINIRERDGQTVRFLFYMVEIQMRFQSDLQQYLPIYAYD